MTNKQDIETIVSKCQSGDRAAFGVLYQIFLVPMRGVVSYYVRNQEAVRDILHDGFLIAFASISSLPDASKAESWLTSIMRNLALQYVREEKGHNHIPISDEADSKIIEGDGVSALLSWEELSGILERLPEGYGKIFRLAVLDGLSHKEIGAMLGIAPHSSSSQLVRAKAMLRRMIKQYRMEAGLLSAVVAVLTLWYVISRRDVTAPSAPVLSRDERPMLSISQDTVMEKERENGGMESKSLHELRHNTKAIEPDILAEAAVENDGTPRANADSISRKADVPDTGLTMRETRHEDLKTELGLNKENRGWSLSLTYSLSGQGNVNRQGTPGLKDFYYADFGPGPDPDPGAATDVTEETHHKIPVIVGVSINKSFNSRWSLETGIRYSFMESDMHRRSRTMERYAKQRIHYIGMPLKVNYRIVSVGGFSLYGHGGAGVDIPVNGQQSSRNYIFKSASLRMEKYRIDAPVQWSVEGGVGIQYHFTPSMSIFAEPSIHYYFNPGGEIRTIRQERPVEFALPIGFRFTW